MPDRLGKDKDLVEGITEEQSHKRPADYKDPHTSTQKTIRRTRSQPVDQLVLEALEKDCIQNIDPRIISEEPNSTVTLPKVKAKGKKATQKKSRLQVLPETPIAREGECLGGRYYWVTDFKEAVTLLNFWADRRLWAAVDLETGAAWREKPNPESGKPEPYYPDQAIIDPFVSPIFLMAVSVEPGIAVVFDWRQLIQHREFKNAVCRFLTNCGIVCHNSFFEQIFFQAHLKVIANIVYDTAIVSQICSAGLPISNDLRSVMERTLGLQMEKDWQKQFLTLHPESPLCDEAIRYSAGDVCQLLNVMKVLNEDLKEKDLTHIWKEIERPLLKWMAIAKVEGLAIDRGILEELRNDIEDRMNKELSRFEELAPNVLITSPLQLKRWFNENGWKIPSTNEKKVLIPMLSQDPNSICGQVAQILLNFREMHKLLTTYIRPMLEEHPSPVTGRIHPDWKQCGASDTGRMSCIAKGTLVEVVRDVSNHPDGIPIEQVKVGDLVYSFDKQRRLCLRRVTWSGKTGHREIVRVHWVRSPDGKPGYIDVTPDHRMRLSDGKYRQALHLQIGDQLLSLVRDNTSGCSKLYATGMPPIEREHQFISANYYKFEPEYVYHLNGNRLDNRIENLRVLVTSSQLGYLKHDSKDKPNQEASATSYSIRVVAIERMNRVEDVYCLTVEETHNFIAAGVCVANCSSPNFQNIPARTELGARIRNAIVARPGHTLVYCDYCLVPGTRVLTADLVWRAVEKLEIGEEIVGFDEDLIPELEGRFRRAFVVSTNTLIRPCYKITTDKGTVIASAEHRWAVRRDGKGSPTWIETQELSKNDTISYIGGPQDKYSGVSTKLRQSFKDGSWINKPITCSHNEDPARVIFVEFIGDQTVIALGTSTRTFIAEGMLSHNSQFEVRALADQACEHQMIQVYNEAYQLRKTLEEKLSELGLPKNWPDLRDKDKEATELIYQKHPEIRELCLQLDDCDFHKRTAATLFKKNVQEVSKSERTAAKCFHPDTEVLTRTGWKRILDLAPGEEIIQGVPDRQCRVYLEWTTPKEVFSMVHPSNRLVHLRSPAIDIRVTPDHRMLYWTARGTPYVATPQDFVKRGYFWCNSGILDDNQLHTVDPVLLRLAIATWAEGSYDGEAIEFKLKSYQKINRLTFLLNVANCNYAQKPGNLGTQTIRIWAHHGSQVQRLLDNGKFPWWWLGLSHELREIILEEIAVWSGERSRNVKKFTLKSCEHQDLDVIQAIAAVTGKKAILSRGKISSKLVVSAYGHSRGGKVSLQEIDHSEDVVCLSVPSTFVLVRHQGIPLVVGQTITFALPYGASVQGIAEQGGLEEDEARQLLEKYYLQFPNVDRFLKQMRVMAAKKGYTMSPLGRKRFYPRPELRDLYELYKAQREEHFQIMAEYESKLQSQSDIEANGSKLKPPKTAWMQSVAKCYGCDDPMEMAKRTLRRQMKGIERQGTNQPIQCVAKGTRVLDATRGYVAIETLVDQNVLIWDGQRFATATVVYSGKKQLVKVTLTDGYYIECSPEHKFLVRQFNSLGENTCSKEIWKTASGLRPEDHVVLTDPIGSLEPPVDIPSIVYLRDLFDVKGIVTTDGILLSVPSRDQQLSWVRKVQELLLLLGIQSQIDVNPNKSRITLRIQKSEASLFLEKIGSSNFERERNLRAISSNNKDSTNPYDRTAAVKSVQVTDDWVEMYDVINSATHRFMANGIIVHNSSNADALKIATVLAAPRLEALHPECKIIGWVHDEILVTGPEELAQDMAAILEESMLEAGAYVVRNCPIEVSANIGKQWGK